MTSLFDPITIGDIALANRVVMAPLTRNRSPNAIPNDLQVEYYRQRAGAGLIITEGTPITQQGQGYADVPGLYKPEAIATEAGELEGKIAKRTLLPGRYIPASAVRDAWLVEQGASVQVYFEAGPLTISAAGVTLQPGAAGDLVKVRNADSGKVITGTVMADGSVRIGAS